MKQKTPVFKQLSAMSDDERRSRLNPNRLDRGRLVQLKGRGAEQYVISRRSGPEIWVRPFEGTPPPIRSKAKHWYDHETDERVQIAQVQAVSLKISRSER